MLVAGNKDYGLARSLHSIYPDAVFSSRRSGFDLTTEQGRSDFSNEALKHDVVVLCSALHSFNQTVLLHKVYKTCVDNNHWPHIISIGSTVDRTRNGKIRMYNVEKKALNDLSNSLGINGVWSNGPKITLISFGTLSNIREKFPDRICMDIDLAASYIKWVIDQPKEIAINELSIDPMQDKHWHD